MHADEGAARVQDTMRTQARRQKEAPQHSIDDNSSVFPCTVNLLDGVRAGSYKKLGGGRSQELAHEDRMHDDRHSDATDGSQHRMALAEAEWGSSTLKTPRPAGFLWGPGSGSP